MTLQLGLSKMLPPICFNAGPNPMVNFHQLLRTVESLSELQQWRLARKHRKPKALADYMIRAVSAELGASTMARDREAAAPCGIQGVSSHVSRCISTDVKDAILPAASEVLPRTSLTYHRHMKFARRRGVCSARCHPNARA